MIPVEISIVVVAGACLLGLIYSLYSAMTITNKNINLQGDQQKQSSLLRKIAISIQEGSSIFQSMLIKRVILFTIILLIIIVLGGEDYFGQVWTSIAFLVGCIVSYLSIFTSTRIETYSSIRIAQLRGLTDHNGIDSKQNENEQLAKKPSLVYGYFLPCFCIIFLLIIIATYSNIYPQKLEDFAQMYDNVLGYALGYSLVSLISRLGHCVFHQSSLISNQIIHQIEPAISQTLNPLTLTLLSSSALESQPLDLTSLLPETICAFLIAASQSTPFYQQPQSFYYPLLLLSIGIIICLILANLSLKKSKWTALFPIFLVTVAVYFGTRHFLPKYIFFPKVSVRSSIYAFFCAILGLLSTLFTLLFSSYTGPDDNSNLNTDSNIVQQNRSIVSSSFKSYAKKYFYNILPAIIVIIAGYTSYFLLGILGVAIAAISMLYTIPSLIAFFSIPGIEQSSNQVCKLIEVSQYNSKISATQAYLAFNIAASTLTFLSLYSVFYFKASGVDNIYGISPLTGINITNPITLGSFILGLVLPFLLSYLLTNSISSASKKMVKNASFQMSQNPSILATPQSLQFNHVVEVSASYSVSAIFWPVIIVISIPLLLGILVGSSAVGSYLPGLLVSGLSISIQSQHNTREQSEFVSASSSSSEAKRSSFRKMPSEIQTKLINDTVKNLLRDSAAPTLNALLRFSAIIALLFWRLFENTSIFNCFFFSCADTCAL